MLVTDHFPKWVQIFPVKNETATTCVEVIVIEVIVMYGYPLLVHIDHVKNYEGRTFFELYGMLEVRKIHTSPDYLTATAKLDFLILLSWRW